jgi:hypothetical protein
LFLSSVGSKDPKSFDFMSCFPFKIVDDN